MKKNAFLLLFLALSLIATAFSFTACSGGANKNNNPVSENEAGNPEKPENTPADTNGENTAEPAEPAEPADPSEPSEPTEPAKPDEPDEPDEPALPEIPSKDGAYEFTVTYPDYNTRAFTLGFDDGVGQDAKLIQMAARLKMKCCTFMLNAGNFSNDVNLTVNGCNIKVHFYDPKEFKEAYKDAEVAGHGMKHLNLTQISEAEGKADVKDGNDKLSSIMGYEVTGFAYAGGAYSSAVKEMLRGLGIEYARTTNGTRCGDLPEDFLEWNPTALETDPKIISYITECSGNDRTDLQCIYIWGHAGELDCTDGYLGGDRWKDMNAVLKKVSTCGNFWAATNGEICRYVKASRTLAVSAKEVKNNSDETIYGLLDGTYKVVIPAHGTLSLVY